MSNLVSSWSSGYNGSISNFTFYGNYMYFPNTNSNKIVQTNLDGTIHNASWASINSPYSCSIYNDSLYVSDFRGGNIYTIVINEDGTAGDTSVFATGFSYPVNCISANVSGTDYLFVMNVNNYISKLSLTSDKTNDNRTWFNCGSDSYGLAVYNGFLYVGNNGGNRVIQINLIDPTIYNMNWATITQGVNWPVYLTIFHGYLYVCNNSGNGYVNKISLTNPTTDYVSNFITAVSSPIGLAVDNNNYLYILSQGYQVIYKMNNTLLDNPKWSVSNGSFGTNFIVFYNNYAYITKDSVMLQLNLNGTINNSNWATLSGIYPSFWIVNNGYLYVTYAGSSIITQILISNPPTIVQTWINLPYLNNTGITVNENILYVANYNQNIITRIPINPNNTAGTSSIMVSSGLTRPLGITYYGGYIYVANSVSNTISRILVSDPTQIVSNWANNVGLGYPSGLAVRNGYLYACGIDSINIVKLSLTDIPTNSIWKTGANGLSYPSGLYFNGDYLYVSTSLPISSAFISQFYLPDSPPVIPPPPPCFKKDTKILTDKGYIPVQYLRKGDLVKTLRNEYKAIHMIGKKLLTHDALQERNKKQLFVYRRDQYPEILEDLVITGCHSILVDRFSSEQQREKTIETNGDIYITDNKYRLPAYADEKAFVFELSGDYMIYHLALENEDYYMNYGVYANGLLVETCSKRYLKECSEMTLIGV
jgi:hypothetical protein